MENPTSVKRRQIARQTGKIDGADRQTDGQNVVDICTTTATNRENNNCDKITVEATAALRLIRFGLVCGS